MAATGKSNYDQLLLEDLQRAVHGLRAPFACGGTFVPERPVALVFPDKFEIPVSRVKSGLDEEQRLEPLIRRCRPAGFGAGRKTRYDRTVRDALHLEAKGGAFSVRNFDPAAAGILEEVRRQLAPHAAAAPAAELYNLNIYPKDGHFAPHKDTPRGGDMLGTLVVCLPSQFANGAFVVKHQGIFQTFDWDEAIQKQAEPERVHWAAFFGDVDHHIERVWYGLRITLTYLLRLGPDSGSTTPSAPDADSPEGLVREKLRALLSDSRFLSKGGTLAFPCAHLYHQDRRFQRAPKPLSSSTLNALKGRDHAVASAAIAEGMEVTLVPYLIETCADQRWQLDHFPTARERAALGDQIDAWDLQEALAVRQTDDGGGFGAVWVDPPPHFNGAPTMYPEMSEGLPPTPEPGTPAIALLQSCEYSSTGYFGNEGGETDMYVYAALHATVPPLGEGCRTAASQLQRARKKRTR